MAPKGTGKDDELAEHNSPPARQPARQKPPQRGQRHRSLSPARSSSPSRRNANSRPVRQRTLTPAPDRPRAGYQQTTRQGPRYDGWQHPYIEQYQARQPRWDSMTPGYGPPSQPSPRLPYQSWPVQRSAWFYDTPQPVSRQYPDYYAPPLPVYHLPRRSDTPFEDSSQSHSQPPPQLMPVVPAPAAQTTVPATQKQASAAASPFVLSAQDRLWMHSQHWYRQQYTDEENWAYADTQAKCSRIAAQEQQQKAAQESKKAAIEAKEQVAIEEKKKKKDEEKAIDGTDKGKASPKEVEDLKKELEKLRREVVERDRKDAEEKAKREAEEGRKRELNEYGKPATEEFAEEFTKTMREIGGKVAEWYRKNAEEKAKRGREGGIRR